MYYHSDKKYTAGHHYKKLFNAELIWNDDQSVVEKSNEELQADPVSLEISFHAPSRSCPQTMRLYGKIAKTSVLVLSDSGRAHNFLSIKLAKKLNLQIQQRIIYGMCWDSFWSAITD